MGRREEGGGRGEKPRDRGGSRMGDQSKRMRGLLAGDGRVVLTMRYLLSLGGISRESWIDRK